MSMPLILGSGAPEKGDTFNPGIGVEEHVYILSV